MINDHYTHTHLLKYYSTAYGFDPRSWYWMLHCHNKCRANVDTAWDNTSCRRSSCVKSA